MNYIPIPPKIIAMMVEHYDKRDTYHPGEQWVDYWLVGGEESQHMPQKTLAVNYILHLAQAFPHYFVTFTRAGMN